MSLIQISQNEGQPPVTIFEIRGRINLGNYKEIEQAAQQAYEKGMRNLVMDFSGVESLTSIGIRTLVVIHKMLAKNGEANSSWLASFRPYATCSRWPVSRNSWTCIIQPLKQWPASNHPTGVNQMCEMAGNIFIP